MMKKDRYLLFLICLLLIITGAVVGKAIRPAVELILEPDHFDMLVSLDGEEDDYYQELTLRCNGKTVAGQKARWHSDDPAVAVVDRYGWVTSKGVGRTVITAVYKGAAVQCRVEVRRKITSDTVKD